MTPRRASALGASLRQQFADVRPRGLATALASAALLLPANLSAATHATRVHHASVESAGKAPAHVVHDTGTHAGRSSSSSSTGHSSAPAPRKGAPAARHAGQPHPDPVDRHNSVTHSGRKHHEQPPDDPPLTYRARTERNPRGSRELSERDLPSHAAARRLHGSASVRKASASAGKHLTRPDATPRASALLDNGLTVDAYLRASPRHRNAANTAGSSAPPAAEDTEASAAPDAPNTEAERTAAAAHAQTATAAVVVSALSQSAPSMAVIEGFGAEVDFHGTPTRAARAPAVVLPRESPAQQERDLRAAADIAAQPMFVPLYARDGQLIVPPPLKGSHDILVHQNHMADDAGLTRIQDDADLDRLRRARLLVDLPESASLRINEGLPENRRSARPWTVKFATDIAHAFYAHFGEPLQVNSAVRTVAYQLRLQRINGNAAAVDGEGASPHLTGQAIDFGKRGMSVAEIAWMRSYLLPLIDAGKIDVEEEFQQACFHISVYASYAPANIHAPARTEVAQVNKATHTHAPASSADNEDNLR